MKQVLTAKYIFVVLLGLALGGSTASAQQSETDKRMLKAQQLYYQGVLSQSLDRIDEAYRLLEYSYHLTPSDPAVAYALGRLSLEHARHEQDVRRGSDLLRRAYEGDTTSLDYMRGYAITLNHNDQRTAAIELLENWLSRHHDSQNEERMLATLYYQAGEYGKALDLYTRLQEATSDSYAEYARLSTVKVALYEASGEADKAVNEMERLIALYPAEQDAKVRMVQHLFRKKSFAEAEPYITALEQSGYEPAMIRSLRIQTARGLGDSIAELRLLNALLDDPDTSAEVQATLWFEFLYSRLQDGKLPTEYNYAFERIVSQHPGDTEAVMAYAQVLGLQGKHRDAIELVRPLTHTRPEAPDVWRSLLGSAISIEDSELITELSLEAIKYIQTDWRYYYYAAVGLYTTGREDEAITLLEKALPSLASLEKEGYSVILGQLGDMYAEQENQTKAYAYYDQALEAHPDNTGVLNNYAYALAEQGRDLDKAERMAARGVKLRGDDANTLDTYAWIFYKREKHSLARLYQSKAIDVAGEDASGVMYDHLGDIYLALEDVKEARSAWTKAIELYNRELEADRGSERTRTRLRAVAEKLAKLP